MPVFFARTLPAPAAAPSAPAPPAPSAPALAAVALSSAALSAPAPPAPAAAPPAPAPPAPTLAPPAARSHTLAHTFTFSAKCPPTPNATSASRMASFINITRRLKLTNTPSGKFFSASAIERRVICCFARAKSSHTAPLTRNRKNATSTKNKSQLSCPVACTTGGVLSANMQSSGAMSGFLWRTASINPNTQITAFIHSIGSISSENALSLNKMRPKFECAEFAVMQASNRCKTIIASYITAPKDAFAVRTCVINTACNACANAKK